MLLNISIEIILIKDDKEYEMSSIAGEIILIFSIMFIVITFFAFWFTFSTSKLKLKKILEGRENREVYLRADKEISYGFVVRVMSELKGAGVENLGMVTEPIRNKEKDKKS